MEFLPVQASMGPVAVVVVVVVVVVQPARAVRWAWLLVYGWACWPTTTIRSCYYGDEGVADVQRDDD
jgi:hypothetical protein